MSADNTAPQRILLDNGWIEVVAYDTGFIAILKPHKGESVSVRRSVVPELVAALQKLLVESD